MAENDVDVPNLRTVISCIMAIDIPWTVAEIEAPKPEHSCCLVVVDPVFFIVFPTFAYFC